VNPRLSFRSRLTLLSARHSTTYIETMLPSLKRTTFIFLVLLALILTYVPMPVSSRPLAILHDRNSHTSNPSYIDDQLVFDVSIAFVLFIALAITCIWITARMTIDRFISCVNRLLTTSVGLVEQVADQLYYLRIGTIFRFATSFLVDADDARRDPTPRPMGGLAHPTSTAGARSIPRRAVDNDPLE